MDDLGGLADNPYLTGLVRKVSLLTMLHDPGKTNVTSPPASFML